MKRPTVTAVACATALLSVPFAALGNSWYVAATGSPVGDGSIGNPWDLQTALNHPKIIKPGDTIWVRGGLYNGPFTSYLKGTSAEPIIVRNYTKERALLDYSRATCDPGDPANQDPFIPSKLKCNGFHADCECDPSIDPSCGPPYNTRGNALTIPGSDSVPLGCSHDVWFWGLEFMNSDPSGRYTSQDDGCGPHLEVYPRSAWEPVTLWGGQRIKFINVAIYDGGVGFVSWVASTDVELYGSLVFNNGWDTPSTGCGHGTYIQNASPSSKRVRDSLFWNNYGNGLDAHGLEGPVDNFTADRDVSFHNGSPHYAYTGVPSPNTGYPNIFIKSGSSGGNIANDSLTRCLTFHSADPQIDYGTSGNVVVSGKDCGGCPVQSATVEDNYIVGAYLALVVANWTNEFSFQRNTIVGGGDPFPGNTERILELGINSANYGNCSWDNNTYYDTTGSHQPFLIQSTNTTLAFFDWKSTTGFDAASRVPTESLPSTNYVAVVPNQYEQGRAYVAIYNWENLTSVTVDLTPSGLLEGQAFKVYSLQSFKRSGAIDYFGDVVASGVYMGSHMVQIPMTDTAVTQPIGALAAVSSTLPAFGAFLVRPELAAPVSVPAVPSPQSWAGILMIATLTLAMGWVLRRHAMK